MNGKWESNDYKGNLPFIIGHYCSYLINGIKLFYLIYSIKSHYLLLNLIKSGVLVLLLDINGWNLKFNSRDLWMHFVVEPQHWNEIKQYFLSIDEIKWDQQYKTRYSVDLHLPLVCSVSKTVITVTWTVTVFSVGWERMVPVMFVNLISFILTGQDKSKIRSCSCLVQTPDFNYFCW